MLNLSKTIPPHTGDDTLYKGLTPGKASRAMIMIHGRGASAESIAALIAEIKADDFLYAVPRASGNTWYPHRFIEPRQTNEPGISSGLALIDAIVKSLNEAGITSDKIYLLGFSQGACLAVDYAARYPDKFAGVFALSGALIGEKINGPDYSGDLRSTPVFFGCSENDFHIPEERIHESAEIFKKLNADVTTRIYPNLGHTINHDEIKFINNIINKG